ncbi:citrulline utilization hydrolase CtlX [Olivibacter sitiensis]|uniref:citrulline utilization hydrolase CtlX n=1 Tax=Olivibacter sitiensis TaxID=376470 RepID=UPI000403422D|nr:arginine deiminase-related protein [Olivibacter sitiensis]
MQTTNTILMIRPKAFRYNEETAGDNAFQQYSDEQNIQDKALEEFDNLVALLKEEGVEVLIFEDTLDEDTPDSLFPNNWLSFHEGGVAALYPMYAPNRRLERRTDILGTLRHDFQLEQVFDLSYLERDDIFLEGTGSMVLDRENKIAYACLSERTNEEALKLFCQQFGYTPITFHAFDRAGKPIYHTNVMMSVGEDLAFICIESITDEEEEERVVVSLQKTGKKIIALSFEQVNQFAGNMLNVHDKNGEQLLVMSEQAYLSLNDGQLRAIKGLVHIVQSPLYTIEKHGGGSARCMMAEVFLDKKA